jgi:pimeloyl-ACP methyl ester carboxylesterase
VSALRELGQLDESALVLVVRPSGSAGGPLGYGCLQTDVVPATCYARNGEVNIAYQAFGDCPLDLVFVPGFISHIELAWEEPYLARFLRRLAAFTRVIFFDKRGTGLSDPVSRPPGLAERMDDIRAVMDAAGSRRAALFGVSDGGCLCIAFAVAHPERSASLVTYGSFARRLPAADYP